jgi:hypothetical protein
MLKTSARGVVPVELLGTCTITVRVKPFTFSDSVVDPGDVDAQPVDVDAEATDVVPATTGTTPMATSERVATDRTAPARRALLFAMTFFIGRLLRFDTGLIICN